MWYCPTVFYGENEPIKTLKIERLPESEIIRMLDIAEKVKRIGETAGFSIRSYIPMCAWKSKTMGRVDIWR